MRILNEQELQNSPFFGDYGFDGCEDCKPIETTIGELATLNAGTGCGEVGNTCFTQLIPKYSERRVLCWAGLDGVDPVFGDVIPGPSIGGMPLIECSSSDEADEIDSLTQIGNGSLRSDSAYDEIFWQFEVE